jgi:acyl dehydratase
VNLFLPQIVEVRGIAMGVNVGADRLRFPAPVPVGARIRGRAELVSADAAKDGGVQAKIRVTVEIEGQERPACVVETLSRYYPASAEAGRVG